MFNGKSVFISGGTGSFGRNFIRRLLEQYQPKRVVVFSRDELKQYEMQQTFNAPCMRYFLGDVRDAEHLPHKNVGIRPGEKLHELMVPLDDARMTLEFSDHYTIQPSIRFTNVDVDYAVNGLGECGAQVDETFEYRSDTNPEFLSVGQIADLHAELHS